jgi:hypothetical protein
MNQTELCRAVARAPGESIGTIRRMGFGLVNPILPCIEPRHCSSRCRTAREQRQHHAGSDVGTARCR